MVVPELALLEQASNAGIVLGELAFEDVELREVVVDAAFEGSFVGGELVNWSIRELRRDWWELVGREWNLSRHRRQLGGIIALAGAKEATETWTVC